MPTSMLSNLLEYIDVLFLQGFPDQDLEKLVAAVKFCFLGCQKGGVVSMGQQNTL